MQITKKLTEDVLVVGLNMLRKHLYLVICVSVRGSQVFADIFIEAMNEGIGLKLHKYNRDP